MRYCFSLLFILHSLSAFSQLALKAPPGAESTLQLLHTISGGLSPKSIVHSGRGHFLSQHMMYRHKITVHNRDYELIATIPDKVTPSNYSLSGDSELLGAPVECAITHQGKYAWVSNYSMTGHGFNQPGCDACSGNKYDSSFVYKINLESFAIENIIAVGAVPKYMAPTPDNSKLVVSNWSSGDLSIIDLNQEIEIERIKVGRHPRGIAITKDSKIAYVAIMASSKIAAVNLTDYSVNEISNIGKGPRHLCLAPDDNSLYVSINGEGVVGKYNIKSGTMTKLKTGRMPRSMILTKDGAHLYVVNYGDNTFSKVSTGPFKIEACIGTAKKPIGITLDESSGKIWVACYTGKLQIFKDTEFKKSLADRSINALQMSSKAFALNFPKYRQRKSTTEINPASKTAQPNLLETDRFYIIAGSFKNLNNATNENRRWQNLGYESTIIRSRKGFYLIALKGSVSKSALKQQLVEMTSENEHLSLWIYTAANGNQIPEQP